MKTHTIKGAPVEVVADLGNGFFTARYPNGLQFTAHRLELDADASNVEAVAVVSDARGVREVRVHRSKPSVSAPPTPKQSSFVSIVNAVKRKIGLPVHSACEVCQ